MQVSLSINEPSLKVRFTIVYLTTLSSLLLCSISVSLSFSIIFLYTKKKKLQKNAKPHTLSNRFSCLVASSCSLYFDFLFSLSCFQLFVLSTLLSFVRNQTFFSFFPPTHLIVCQSVPRDERLLPEDSVASRLETTSKILDLLYKYTDTRSEIVLWTKEMKNVAIYGMDKRGDFREKSSQRVCEEPKNISAGNSEDVSQMKRPTPSIAASLPFNWIHSSLEKTSRT